MASVADERRLPGDLAGRQQLLRHGVPPPPHTHIITVQPSISFSLQSNPMNHLFGIGRVPDRLERAVQRDLLALRVDLADECLQGRRLACLARRMQNEVEVLLPVDKPPHARLKYRSASISRFNPLSGWHSTIFHVSVPTSSNASANSPWFSLDEPGRPFATVALRTESPSPGSDTRLPIF